MDVIWNACSGSMISREAATSGQLSLIHRGISDVKDVSNNLKILEVEQLAFQWVGGVKESSRFQTCLQLNAWFVHARSTARMSTCHFLKQTHHVSLATGESETSVLFLSFSFF